MSSRPGLRLTENALTVLRTRYLWRDAQGDFSETPDGMFERVAVAIAKAERRDRTRWTDEFLRLMVSRRFIPNSPTLMNAGKPKAQLSACFVLPVEDSLDSIFDTLKYAAKIHQSGGGTGFSFSRLRPKGSIVQTTHGVASGPVSFMKIYDSSTETIKQGGTRRGANMAVLRVDHPDVQDFVRSKLDQKSVLNFNISVGITDSFMRAVEAGGDFDLKDPRSGKVVESVPAKRLFDSITQAAWECGDPGLVFLDRINLFNPTPQLGEMESTNPCGEQPLLPFESCNLGSLNLGEYQSSRGFDWPAFERDIEVSVRFLDNVIELNHYPVEQCGQITLRNRKIGLGVMGFADLLLAQGLPYDSAEARSTGEAIMSFLDRAAKRSSCLLAREKGAFPNWQGSMWRKLGYPPLRNATVSTVAPTGTISIIAGASSGIEPLFSGVFVRNVLAGKRLLDVHPAVERAFRAQGISESEWSTISDETIAARLGKAWSPAQSVSVSGHVQMQAVFQRHSDSAVSKTINLPESAPPEEVSKAYWLAFRLGCKGITVYRDKSRSTQVLESPNRAAAANPEPEGEYCPSC